MSRKSRTPQASKKKGRSRRGTARPVDVAMSAERPEKAVIRQFWLDVIRAADTISKERRVPLYFTLCGAEARDIQMLIEDGLIQLTETGAISSESLYRVVAIERNREALLQIKRLFPGITTRGNLDELLRGSNPIRFPVGEDVSLCRAVVVNLDLNEIFDAQEDEQGITFSLLTRVKKLCQIHAVRPRIDWWLCLTLHGEIRWSASVCEAIQDFLLENFRQDASFSAAVRQFLGEQFFNEIMGEDGVSFVDLDTVSQQRILMIVVPKKIAQSVNADGWKVRTTKNVRYGGTVRRAPMVSWVLEFRGDNRSSRRPQEIYIESLRSILASPHHINQSGSISIR